jgi:hypothetical protein
MKRSLLARRSPLKARSRTRTGETGAREFKEVRRGSCEVCGRHGLVRRHHVLLEQIVRREGGDPWALANAMWIGCESVCGCHARHHSAFQKIPVRRVPWEAIHFAVRLLGADRAVAYFERRYAP